MADSIHAQITANLKTALAALTAANGYSFTVAAVEEVRLTESPNARYPFVLIDRGAVSIDDNAELNNAMNCTLPYSVILVDTGNDENETANGEISYSKRNYVSDIIKAIMTDHTRGGLAETTMIKTFGDGVYSGAGASYICFVEIEVRALIDVLNPYLKG